MGFFMIALLIISIILTSIIDFGKSTKSFLDANKKREPTYRDSKGNIRNSSNGHLVNVDTAGREFDSWTGKMLYNPYEKKEKEEMLRAERLGYSKCRVFNSKAEEISNGIRFNHKVIYHNKDQYNHKYATPYGKLNCNLGYQFWVNLSNGRMEETELSKSIPHMDIKKYHKIPLDKRRRKKQIYKDDLSNPYTKEEIKRECEKILEHLKNHNENILRRGDEMNVFQKFTPYWCYNPNESYLDVKGNKYWDGVIYDYEIKQNAKLVDERTEGYYD